MHEGDIHFVWKGHSEVSLQLIIPCVFKLLSKSGLKAIFILEAKGTVGPALELYVLPSSPLLLAHQHGSSAIINGSTVRLSEVHAC